MAVLFSVLTVLTQIGGVIYLITWGSARWFQLRRIPTLLLFGSIYLIATFGLVPFMAPLGGRMALPLSGKVHPLTMLTCLLNRHYVRPELKQELMEVATELESQYPGTSIRYLDACFPFGDGFPLLPHLSHNDGRKIDLAFYYLHLPAQQPTEDTPSRIGYGVYDDPKVNEVNYCNKCLKQGFWQYDLLSHLLPQGAKGEYTTDTKRTSRLLTLLAKNAHTSKLFIEPHLKTRWQLDQFPKIRFQGCHAIRHDDHIHLQIR